MVVAVTRPRAQGYGASIGDDWFRLAPSPDVPLRYYNRDSLAERQDDRGSPEENVLDLGYAFSRSNLTGGEGLDWYPRPAGEQRRDTDSIRFWDSADVSVRRPDAGRPYTLQLVKAKKTFATLGASITDLGTSRTRLYVITGTTVTRYDDLSNTTADDTDNIGTTLVQLAVGPDDAVAVLDTNGDVWYKAPTTETYLKIYDSATDGPMLDAKAIWIVKGRIIAYCRNAAAATDAIMLEIAPVITGTPASPTEGTHVYTTIDTFPCVMNDCVDAGHAIIAVFNDGSVRSYVPQTDAAGDVPVLTIRARATVPVGENPYQLGWNLGTLLILTLDNDATARLYMSQVLDERFDYVIGGLQLFRVWEGSAETAPNYTKAMVSTRDEIMFWIGESASHFNLWRFDLVTEGLFRERKDDLTSVTSLGFLQGETVWATTTAISQTDPTLYKSTGYLITPNVTFGLNTPINWTSFVTEALQLTEAGVEVTLYRSSDPDSILDPNDAGWVLVDTLSDPLHSGVEQIKSNVTSNSQSMKVVLTASSDLEISPNVTRFAMRGLPRHRDWIAEIPINISDTYTAPGRYPQHCPGLGDQIHAALLAKEGESTTLTVLDPPITLRGIVDKIIEPVTVGAERGSWGRVLLVQFRGSRVGTGGAEGGGDSGAVGTTGLGFGLMGVAIIGVDT